MGCGCKGAQVRLGCGVASDWCVARNPLSRPSPSLGTARLRRAAACRTSYSRYQASPAQSTATASLPAAVSRIWRHGEPWCALDVVGPLVGLHLRMSLVGTMGQTTI